MFPESGSVVLTYGVNTSRGSTVFSAEIIFRPLALRPRTFFIFSTQQMTYYRLQYFELTCLLYHNFLILFHPLPIYSGHLLIHHIFFKCQQAFQPVKINYALSLSRILDFVISTKFPLDITGNIMSFWTSHFSLVFLIGQFWGRIG